MTAPTRALFDELANLGNRTLCHHWHAQLCRCSRPDNCPDYPPDTWNIAESLRIVLPELLAAYDQHKEQQ